MYVPYVHLVKVILFLFYLILFCCYRYGEIKMNVKAGVNLRADGIRLEIFSLTYLP